MASWMIHFRVAQAIYERLMLPSASDFVLGNIAPDSGVPTADGLGYDPPSAVSHFNEVDANGVKGVHEEIFIAQYLSDERLAGYSPRELSFYLGYLTHLLTDKIWVRDVVYPSADRFPELFASDRPLFWRKVKRDWYDLDFLYFKHHPDFEAFHLYRTAPDIRNVYLPFFAENAFEVRRSFIIDYYRNGAQTVAERETYLSFDELDALIARAAEEIIGLCQPYIAHLCP